MKNVIFVLAMLIIGFNSTLFSQSIPDPEFSARPYILEVDNSLKNLERPEAQVENKAKAMGYGGVETFYTAFEQKSNVRISKSALPKMIIKVENNIDPSDIIVLSKAVEKKDRRRFLQGSLGIYGKARDVSTSYIKLEFKKIRDGIFEIIIPNDIQQGEYAFLPINSQNSNQLSSISSKIKISCFGVD